MVSRLQTPEIQRASARQLQLLIGEQVRDREFEAREQAAGTHLGTRLQPQRQHRLRRQETEHQIVGAEIERPAQLALAGLLSIGALVARRLPGTGAVVMAVAAACLGVFAAIQYPPAYATVLTALLMVPAFLTWLGWQHRRTPHELTAVAVTTALLVGATWTGARSVYDSYFGPTHPESATPGVPVDEVRWVLAGAISPDSVTVTARLQDPEATAVLRVTSGPDDPGSLSDPATTDEYGVVRMHVEGLAANTRYSYRVVVDAGPRAYPAVLFDSADHDDRVDPLHARKLAAVSVRIHPHGPTHCSGDTHAEFDAAETFSGRSRSCAGQSHATATDHLRAVNCESSKSAVQFEHQP